MTGSNPDLKVEEKYTEQEIEVMADKCFKHCDWCDRYEPVHVDRYIQKKNDIHESENIPLFNFCDNGCYYAHEFPWNRGQKWCIFWGLKDNKNKELKKISDILAVLTKANLKTETK